MAQTDLDVANASGSVVRGDINNHLEALATLSSGASAPSSTFANMWWFDTTNNLLKRRDNGDSTWYKIATGDQPFSTVSVTSGPRTIAIDEFSKTLKCDASGGAFSVEPLAAATAGNGFFVTIIKIDSSDERVTINPSGTETVNGALSIKLNRQYDAVTLVCDGSNWFAIADKRQVGFMAHRNGTDQTMPDHSTWTKVNLTNDTTAPGFDTNADFDNSTYIWTCREPGLYMFTASVTILAISPGYYARCRLYKNGSALSNGSSAANGGSGASQTVSTLSAIVECAIGDEIELYAYHNDNSGGTRDIEGSTYNTNLTGAWIK